MYALRSIELEDSEIASRLLKGYINMLNGEEANIIARAKWLLYKYLMRIDSASVTVIPMMLEAIIDGRDNMNRFVSFVISLKNTHENSWSEEIDLSAYDTEMFLQEANEAVV